ncbi:unnamed protein product, partial [Ectocarpus sp. 8 AP-2014]
FRENIAVEGNVREVFPASGGENSQGTGFSEFFFYYTLKYRTLQNILATIDLPAVKRTSSFCTTHDENTKNHHTPSAGMKCCTRPVPFREGESLSREAQKTRTRGHTKTYTTPPSYPNVHR